VYRRSQGGKEKETSFAQCKEVDGVIVTVIAEAGVFPVGAELYVRKVSREEELGVIEEAVEEKREEGRKVSGSSSYDIKGMLDGEEIEPDTISR